MRYDRDMGKEPFRDGASFSLDVECLSHLFRQDEALLGIYWPSSRSCGHDATDEGTMKERLEAWRTMSAGLGVGTRYQV